MLVIELDGGQHNETENLKYDNSRTNFIETEGYKVLRFWNNDVLNDIESILTVIKSNID